MFGLFNKRNKKIDGAEKSCKLVKSGKLTDEIIEHVKLLCEKYNQENHESILVEFCEDETLLQSQNSFDLPLFIDEKDTQQRLHEWIKEYQSDSYILEFPYEFDQIAKKLLSGYENDDSYECLFEQIQKYCRENNCRTVKLAFGISPWSELFECEDCVRIFW